MSESTLGLELVSLRLYACVMILRVPSGNLTRVLLDDVLVVSLNGLIITCDSLHLCAHVCRMCVCVRLTMVDLTGLAMYFHTYTVVCE